MNFDMLDHEEWRFVQTLNEKCITSAGLFEVLSEKFRLQHNETILSMKYCKFIRRQNKNAGK